MTPRFGSVAKLCDRNQPARENLVPKPHCRLDVVEARAGIEPTYTALQAAA